MASNEASQNRPTPKYIVLVPANSIALFWFDSFQSEGKGIANHVWASQQFHQVILKLKIDKWIDEEVHCFINIWVDAGTQTVPGNLTTTGEELPHTG